MSDGGADRRLKDDRQQSCRDSHSFHGPQNPLVVLPTAAGLPTSSEIDIILSEISTSEYQTFTGLYFGPAADHSARGFR
jgi:hypothetical protein